VRKAVVAFALLGGAVAAACGGSEVQPTTPESLAPSGTNVEVAELEISATGVDRFASCPPPGELGQDWIPPIPPWRGPSASSQGSDTDAGAEAEDPTVHGQTPTERAIADTRERFRACWHRSLIYDPTQDGHVAIVLRIGSDGRVAHVESYGACDLSSEAIQCMKDTTKKLRFRPPEGGTETLTIPAVLTSAAPRSSAPSRADAYAAAAYITIEGLRPALHACEESARGGGRAFVASGTFALDVDEQGKVTHVNVDPWSGAQDLLACAAKAFEGAHFGAPPGGRATILARVAFNPRAGTK